jgi:hypothetical protein
MHARTRNGEELSGIAKVKVRKEGVCVFCFTKVIELTVLVISTEIHYALVRITQFACVTNLVLRMSSCALSDVENQLIYTSDSVLGFDTVWDRRLTQPFWRNVLTPSTTFPPSCAYGLLAFCQTLHHLSGRNSFALHMAAVISFEASVSTSHPTRCKPQRNVIWSIACVMFRKTTLM